MTTFAPELVDYGIHLERSDIRAHIGVRARRVFIFKTADALAVIQQENLELADAYQPGVIGRTAEGWKMPLEKLPRMKSIAIADWRFEGWTKELSPKEKGRRAVEIVKELLKHGRFPLWINADEDDRENIQISGTDILIFARKRIQVKCDYDAGPRCVAGCTGNLYLQKKECNPLKQH